MVAKPEVTCQYYGKNGKKLRVIKMGEVYWEETLHNPKPDKDFWHFERRLTTEQAEEIAKEFCCKK